MSSCYHAVVYCCAYMPFEVVFSGGGDALIKSWNILTGENILTLQRHTQEVVRYRWCCAHFSFLITILAQYQV